jgi:hypothetical protein
MNTDWNRNRLVVRHDPLIEGNFVLMVISGNSQRMISTHVSKALARRALVSVRLGRK